MPKMAQSADEVLASCAISRGARSRSPSATTRSSRRSRATSSASPISQPWDLAYASEKLKARRYAFSEQEVRRYFPEDKVLAGLFRVVGDDLRRFRIRESAGRDVASGRALLRRPATPRAR